MVNRRQVLGLMGAAAAATLPLARGAQAALPKTLRIGWQKNGVLALAKSQGALEKLFADRGVQITWSEFSSGPPLLEALGAGALDLGPTGDVPPLFAQAARGNLVYIGTYKGSAAGSAILVNKDSPIRTLADLKGKKLAFKRGSSAHNVAVQALRKAGLSLSDVTLVDLAPPDAAAAFKTGSIDAWSIWDPYTAVAEADPQTRVLTTAEGIVDSWSYFLANGDFAKEHGDLIPEIFGELSKVGKRAQADLATTVPALSAITGVPEDVTRITLTRAGFDLGAVDTVSDAAIAYQQALADEFFELKILPKKLTITDIVWRPKAS
ncbi:sulfonate transport system substrate-binding protein [Neorhizobium galegae]|uniref:aliphatic sulfonate ABC transporter substrate-binding protein n=1 Tax=Rhizobium/Agrobacterium group TaxID=227290 RepID=UPI001AE876AF|nr:aliphatic sulfonate ABC transporter substrate-binding protein [Neorhizobium galegae]MBP2549319.1 sulfonate transport system substrate-binding protein [Neorhizobium galegae]